MRRLIPWRLSLLGSVAFSVGLTMSLAAQDRPSASAKQEPQVENTASVMASVNSARTRVYDSITVSQPKSALWKTSRLFITDGPYPYTLTFEGIPGMTSQTHWVSSGHQFSEPVLIDGTIYFSVYINDGYVFAQQSATGGDKWRFKQANVTFSAVAVAGGVVYVGGNNGTFYALNGATGEELWNKEQKGREFYTASPAIADGVVYFSSTESFAVDSIRPDGRIFAFALGTGNQLWVFKTKGTIGSAAYADKTVFAGDSEGYLHALDAATGHERWKFKSSGGGVRSPTVRNSVVYFSAHDGSLHAVDAETGKERWKNTKEPKVAGQLAVDNGTIYFSGEQNNLYAVDAANGQLKWTFKTGKRSHSPVLAGGVVCFPTGEGIMHGLDAATGAEKWTITDLNKVVSAPIFARGVIYFLDGAGHLYAVK